MRHRRQLCGSKDSIWKVLSFRRRLCGSIKVLPLETYLSRLRRLSVSCRGQLHDPKAALRATTPPLVAQKGGLLGYKAAFGGSRISKVGLLASQKVSKGDLSCRRAAFGGSRLLAGRTSGCKVAYGVSKSFQSRSFEPQSRLQRVQNCAKLPVMLFYVASFHEKKK